MLICLERQQVLLNAIYFKGIWETQFDKGSTQDHDFHSLEGSQQPVSRVKMMTLRDKQVNGVEDHVVSVPFFFFLFPSSRVVCLKCAKAIL